MKEKQNANSGNIKFLNNDYADLRATDLESDCLTGGSRTPSRGSSTSVRKRITVTLPFKLATAFAAAAMFIAVGALIKPTPASAQFGGDAFSAGDTGTQLRNTSVTGVTPQDTTRLTVFNTSSETQRAQLIIVDALTGDIAASRTVSLQPLKGDFLDFSDTAGERIITGVVIQEIQPSGDGNIIASLLVRELTGRTRLIASPLFLRHREGR
jgi:hypothetical protein